MEKNEKIIEIKSDMIKEALKKHKRIHPASVYRTIDECFTIEENKIFLWFNTEPDFSTKLLEREIPS